jgi:hypothetical protein
LSWRITAIGVFLFFGAVTTSLAGTSLVWPGTVLERMWMLNAPAYARFAPFAKLAGIGFLVLGTTLALAGVGWFKRRRWAWRLTVVIIATQVLGDVANAFMGGFVRGAIGVVIAGALLLYLLRPEVRSIFREGSWQPSPTPP